MSIRQTLQSNPALFAGAAVLLLGFAVWRMAAADRGNPLENHRYFYDLGSGALFTYDVRAMPPVPAPSGSDGVLATVYMCGACSDDGASKIAYIETYTEEAIALMQKASTGETADPGAMAAAQAQRLIAAPSQAPQWMTFDDPRSGQLLSFADQCPGGKAEICLP